ncbi:MAG: hypothetical protein ABIS47_05075 [Acidimicrobiales bacterium]
MRMFTKLGVTAATAALPVLLWAGAAGAQTSSFCQSPANAQSPQCVTTIATVATSLPNTSSVGSGGLARTGADDLLPLAVGGAALAGALAVRRGLRHRSPA